MLDTMGLLPKLQHCKILNIHAFGPSRFSIEAGLTLAFLQVVQFQSQMIQMPWPFQRGLLTRFPKVYHTYQMMRKQVRSLLHYLECIKAGHREREREESFKLNKSMKVNYAHSYTLLSWLWNVGDHIRVTGLLAHCNLNQSLSVLLSTPPEQCFMPPPLPIDGNHGNDLRP